jgi:hypothetical protein
MGGPRFCCKTAPRVYQSNDNEMVVIFYSKKNSNFGSIGFQANLTFFERKLLKV